MAKRQKKACAAESELLPAIPRDGEFHHVSVLLNECVDNLQIRQGLTYVDATTGGGGHSLQIAQRLRAAGGGRLICFDRDADALKAASERLRDYTDMITFVHANFSSVGDVLDDLKIDNLGGMLADLGCSSYQFDTAERGFSYQLEAPLDMRMDKDMLLSADTVVNEYPEERLREIIDLYGEERFASAIAARIVRRRQEKRIETTTELSDIIRSAIPARQRIDGPHPAKRTFQAIRIEVNGELDAIAPAICAAAERMTPSGRLVIISFHSLEDRIVKQTYADLSAGCTCPRDFPVCVCGKKPTLSIVNKKPILPSSEELSVNPRSRSAKLRVAEKCGE